MSRLALSLLVACASCAASEEGAGSEEEGSPTMILYKKLSPADGYSVNKPINVTLTVFNKGPGNAYGLMVVDDSWKADKFRIVTGGNNFTLDFLNAGDSYEHEFVIRPIKKTWARVKPAKMIFSDSVEEEAPRMLHLSNTLPEMRIALKNEPFEKAMLMIGRVLTLNAIKTKEGWMSAAVIGLVLFIIQLYYVGSAVLHKRRHLRALENVKKL